MDCQLPSCRALLVRQLCFPATPITTDGQLVLLTRTRHQAHARCLVSPEVPHHSHCPLPAPHQPSGIACVEVGSGCLGLILSACMSSPGPTGRHLCFPRPQLPANNCLPPRAQGKEGQPQSPAVAGIRITQIFCGSGGNTQIFSESGGKC